MRLLSPRELADALGVSESSLKRWADAGKIHASRTEGGHRRITLSEAVRFIRATGAPVVRPDLLGMPELAASQQDNIATDDGSLLALLRSGDGRAVKGWVMARYLGGASVAELCDGPIRGAMHALGELWHHEADGVFIEHRATDLALQAIAHLRGTFEPPDAAPVAVGATPEDDPYILPSFMAAAVVAAAGLRAVNLGADTPVMALKHAVAHHRPRLVWISASAPVPPARAREIATFIANLPSSIVGVVGGRQRGAIAAAYPGVRVVVSMTELAAIAQQLAPPAAAG